MFFGFEDQRAGRFAQHLSVTIPVVRLEGGGGVLRIVAEFLPDGGVDGIDRIDAGAGGADDHDVGGPAADDRRRFADDQVAGRFVHRQRVVRAAGVGENADVAGGHIGQVLEHPERFHLAQALLTPLFGVEVRLFIHAFAVGVGQRGGGREHQVRAEFHTNPLVVDRVRIECRVFEGQGRGRDAELNFAAHHLDVLANGLKPRFAGGRLGEFADFGSDLAGRGGAVKSLDGADATAAFEQSGEEGIRADPQRAEESDAGDDHVPRLFLGTCHCSAWRIIV